MANNNQPTGLVPSNGAMNQFRGTTGESNEGFQIKIHILEKLNYTIWKRHTLNVLEAKGLNGVVTGQVMDPVKERQARALLTSALSPDNQMKVINCLTAAAIWTRLEAIYENKTSFEKESLIGKLHGFKITSAKQVPEAISEMENIAAKLRLLGETVSDESLISAILRALPKTFKTFTTIWKGTVAAERTIDNLLSRLMAEIDDEDEGEKALIQKPLKKGGQPGKRTGKKFNKNKDKTCYFCKKPGHFKKDCRKLQAQNGAPSGSPKPQDKAGLKKVDKHVVLAAGDERITTWVIDGGATSHVTAEREFMFDFEEFAAPMDIGGFGQETSLKAFGRGKISTDIGVLSDVLYIPDAAFNLFSESHAASKGVFNKNDAKKKTFFKDGKELFEAHLCGKLYIVNLRTEKVDEQAMSATTLDVWHRRLGHVNKELIKKMAKEKVVDGLEIVEEKRPERCEDCIMGKCHKGDHPNSNKARAKRPGASLHFDTVGPFEVESMGGAKYFLLCKDEFSTYRMIRFVGHKSDLVEQVKSCISKAEYDTGRPVLQIVSDNGTEFVNREIQKFLAHRGINHIRSVVYTPSQNGFIERDIRTVVESGRTMLSESKLDKSLWAEAMNTAVYVLNRTINSKVNKTPYELWTGQVPNLKNMRIFGEEGFIHIDKKFRGKLDGKGVKVRFVGYTDKINTYRFYDPVDKCVIIRCDADFTEKYDSVTVSVGYSCTSTVEVSHWDEGSTEEGDSTDGYSEEYNSPKGKVVDDIYDVPNDARSGAGQSSQSHPGPSRQNTDLIQLGSQIPKNLKVGFGKHQRNPEILDKRLRSERINLATLDAAHDPTSYREAMDREDREQWVKAMKDELLSLEKNHVFELVNRPADVNVVTNRWVFVTKRKPDGTIDRYKARLVARGFSQVYGEDYNQTYAPVVNCTSIRLLFAYAARNRLTIGQFDIKTAFLNGELDETIYMEQPEGFEDGKNKVCLLKRSLYGLKQAPRQWNKRFTDTLKEIGLQVSENDECIFFKTEPMVIIAIYVDDGLIFSDDPHNIEEVMSQLKEFFELHDEDVTTYLGFQIEREDDGSIRLHQQSYVNKILNKFKMDKSRPVDNPCSKSVGVGVPLDRFTPYREAIGSLMYAANVARPDIAYAVGKASRKVADPTEEDWKSVKRIFRYLVDKDDLALRYHPESRGSIEAYCDADYAGDDSGKSTSGYVVLYSGGPIDWRSKRQDVVSRSSTEAELESMVKTVSEVTWIRNLAMELGIIKDVPVPVYCDNQSTIKIVTNEKSAHRTRHLRAKAAYVRSKIESKEVTVSHVKGEFQRADMLTKETTSKQFIRNRNWLMHFMTILCMFGLMNSCNAVIFDRVAPIIWQKTSKYVDRGLKHYIFELHLTSPCEILRQLHVPQVGARLPHLHPQDVPTLMSQGHNLPVPQIGSQVATAHATTNQVSTLQQSIASDYHTALEDAVGHCNQVWMDYIELPVQSLPRPRSREDIDKEMEDREDQPGQQNELVRNKRDLTGGIVTGLVFSNILTTVFDKLFTSGEQAEERARQRKYEQELAELQHLVNTTLLLEEASARQYMIMGELIKNNAQRTHAFITTFPHLSFATQYMALKMVTQGNAIKALINNAGFKQILLINLSELLNIRSKDLVKIRQGSVQFLQVSTPARNVIRVEFLGREVDKTSEVFKVYPFRYWANLTDKPRWMEYIGDTWLLYNKSSNCVKGLKEPMYSWVTQECKTRDGADSSLSSWKTLITVDDIETQPKVTTWLETYYHVYVYCYRMMITIGGEDRRCPPFVFVLNASISWNTSDHRHEGRRLSEEERMFRVDLGIATHQVHFAHFQDEEHLIDENAAIDAARNWMLTAEKARKANIAVSFGGENHMTYKTALYMVSVVSGFSIIMIIVCLIVKWKTDEVKHENVMRIVTDGFKGEGTYEEIKKSKHNFSSQSQTSVAPAQVNVTLNSPVTSHVSHPDHLAPEPPRRNNMEEVSSPAVRMTRL